MNEHNVTLTPISRDDAAQEGRTFFFTGRPCINGHLSQRYVSMGGCVDCMKRSRRKVLDRLKAHRIQRGALQPWAIFQCEEALMPTAIATLRALGCTVKEPIKPHPAAANWRPPEHLVAPVISQTEPVDFRRGQEAWQETMHDRTKETVEMPSITVLPLPPLPSGFLKT